MNVEATNRKPISGLYKFAPNMVIPPRKLLFASLEDLRNYRKVAGNFSTSELFIVLYCVETAALDLLVVTSACVGWMMVWRACDIEAVAMNSNRFLKIP